MSDKIGEKRTRVFVKLAQAEVNVFLSSRGKKIDSACFELKNQFGKVGWMEARALFLTD